MKKLINKFKLLSEDPVKCAEECKKIAIEFAKWSQNYYLFEGTDNWMDDDLYSPIEPKYTSTDLFNKFIEDEYGKQ